MNRSVTMAVPRHDPVGKAEVSAMQRWIVAICAIRFDLQQGQVSCFGKNLIMDHWFVQRAQVSIVQTLRRG